MNYMVWQVFGDKGLTMSFYVINIHNKAIQSVWKNYIEAKKTCDKLNTDSKQSKKGA